MATDGYDDTALREKTQSESSKATPSSSEFNALMELHYDIRKNGFSFTVKLNELNGRCHRFMDGDSKGAFSGVIDRLPNGNVRITCEYLSLIRRPANGDPFFCFRSCKGETPLDAQEFENLAKKRAERKRREAML